ncbi:helicase conserved C-terminal domain-containing protein [Cryptosporidium andersoni]|uniref:Helicase conserved C-terminal domain-containing protein n=1 Tax=Cryptosporidium andersoni TaxID=117008 RepID=A0A1J4MSC8_9CRYT|nr:helicase conserved C-terminal domain-containing protein [Cryptosporidium andersoni]
MDINNINCMDRWVPLGILWLYGDNIVDIDLNNRCWLSKLHGFKELINLKKINNYDVWYHLSKICDGIRIDTMIERIIVNNNIKPDLNLIEYCRKYNLKSNNTISLPMEKSVNIFRAIVWINLSIKLLSKYNCDRAILSVPTFNSFYQVIFHLNTVIYDNTLVCSHRDICLYNLYYEMLRGNLVRNTTKYSTIESSYNKDLGKLSYSYCNILGCLEHVKAPNFSSKDINVSDLMDCVEVKIGNMAYNGNFILDTSNLTKNMETDHKEDYNNIIPSSNSAITPPNNTQLNLDFVGCGLNLINHSNKIQGINVLLPKEIWLSILDYLDVMTCKEFGSTCRLFKSIWLIHHHNNLLPHQRQSVAWLLQREFGSLNYKDYVDNGDNNWIFDSNPIKFLRHCNDEFKSLSFWYYIPIQGFLKNDNLILLIKKSLNSQLICNVNEIFGEIIQDHLFGLKVHPSIILGNFEDISKLFCKDWIPSCCLYVSHCNQVIYFGYLPNLNEINSNYTKLSVHGSDILRSYTHYKKYKDRQVFYENFGGILCDDPGLGKTLTILSLISKTPDCLSKIDIENFSESGIIHFPQGVQYLVRDIHNGNISFLYEKNNQECINRYLGDKMNYLEFKETLEKSNMGNRRKYRSNLQNSRMKRDILQSKSTLILVPNHLIQHWKSELEKWFAVPKLSEYDYSLRQEQNTIQNEDSMEIRRKRVRFDLNNLNNKNERDYSESYPSNKSDTSILHINKEDHTVFGNLSTGEARVYSKELLNNNPNSVYLSHKEVEGYIGANEALLQSPIFIFDDPKKDVIPDAEILSRSNIVILSYRMLTKQFQMCKIKKEYTRVSSKVQKNFSKIKSLSMNSDKSCKMSYNSLDLSNSQFEYVNSPILKVKWLRLIVDEGHNIGSSSITSSLYKQFIFKIESNYRWIMSGTPLPVSLYKCINTYIPNIFEFLRLPIIWSKKKNWNLGDDINNVFKVYNLPEYSSLSNGDPSSSNLIQEDLIINEHNYSDDFIYDKFISDNIVTEPSNSVFKSITKKSTSDKHGDFISPMGLFGLILQLGSITVYHRKDSCLKNYLPSLIGPEKVVLRPFIKNELLVYNILVELLQRNLFCTFYNTENVDSLLHTSNTQYRQDILWNLRFSSVLGFIVTLSKLEGNKDRGMDYIYNICKIPKLFVNSHDIQELELMLLNTHPLYVNNLYYDIYSMDRLKFVLYLYSRFNGADLDFDYDESGLIDKNTCNNLSYDSHSKALYKCDSCQKPVIFPLIIPCKYLHLTCINCIMFKLGYKPIEVKWDCSDKNEYNNLKGYGNFRSYMNNLNCKYTLQCKNSSYISQNIIEHNKSTSKRYIWPKRAGVNYCIICGPEIRINSDFFDRLQVPIQIKYPESVALKDYQNPQNREFNTYSRNDQHNIIHNNVNLCGTFSKILPVSILNALRKLLIGSFDDPRIDSILTRLYTEKIVQDTGVRINNMYISGSYFATSVHSANNLPVIALISLSSSKLRYVIHCILNNLDTYPRSKIMIVSNFWQQLDFLYNTLNIFNIRTCRFYPHIPKAESLFTINDFQTKPDISVLLLSVELGSHGLDLSCVSFIYIIDPITDEGIEKQTIARAYRMREIVSKGGGQVFPKDINCDINCKSTSSEYLSFVKVTYCLVEDTIEDILYDYVKHMRKIQFDNKYINSRRNLNIKRKRSHTNNRKTSQGGQSHIRGSSQKLENILNPIKNDIEITENEDLIDNLDPTQALLRIFINK